jgi:hypothetical protein
MQLNSLFALLFVLIMLTIQTTSLRLTHHVEAEMSHESQEEQPHRHFKCALVGMTMRMSCD